MLKTYRVTLTDTDNVPHALITEAFTCDHASANAYEAYGKSVRIRAVELSELAPGSYCPMPGDRVSTPNGGGVITDVSLSYREALVRLDNGTFLDTTHGQWTEFADMTRAGFDPDASVWFGQGVRLAGELY